MGSDWQEVKIDDIKANSKGSIAIGPFGSRMKSDCYVKCGVPVIRGTNITGGPAFEGAFVYITEEKADSLGSCNVYRNDLVFPHRGSIGEVGIITDDRRYIISSSLMKLTCDNKRVNPRYMYYFFKSQTGKHELLKNASQVGTPGIGQPLASLKAIELKLPPIESQNKIEHVLTCLDDKIELNRKMNTTLESMAQGLFKSWFVDFDPVIDNALAAGNPIPEPLHVRAETRKDLGDKRKPLPEAIQRQFPSRFVFSDEMGWLPEGWEAKQIKDFVEVTDYVANGSFASLKNNVTVFDEPEYALYIRTTDYKNGFNPEKAKYVDNHSYEFLKKSRLDGDEVIISNVGDTGTVFKAPRWLNKPMTLGSNAIALRANNMSNFLHLYFSSYFGQHQISGIVGGSAQPKFNKTDFRSLNIYFGTRALVTSFEEYSKSTRLKIEFLMAQSVGLARLRDILLPKLLSGQLRVPDAEKLMAEAL